MFLQRDHYNKSSKLRCIYSVCSFIAVANYATKSSNFRVAMSMVLFLCINKFVSEEKSRELLKC